MSRPRTVYVKPKHAAGSKYKYVRMLERVCDLDVVSRLPQRRQHDFAVMIGYDRSQYRALIESGTPYLLIANDVFGMRWEQPDDGEAECARNASYVITNTPETLEWLQENYGVKGGSVVFLRPLASDLDFEPLPKLEGKNIVYAGGLVANSAKYSYRDYREIFAVLQDAGWTVHCYPGWGYTGAVDHYKKIGCVVHDPVPDGAALHRELSQYQVGFQGYAHGSQHEYCEAARPNKLWLYLAAGIPTVGYNTGRGGDLYAGKWGTVARSLKTLPAAADRASKMQIPDELRRSQVIDADIDVFRAAVAEICKPEPLKVALVAKGNICRQVSLIPKALREHSGIECHGFFKKDHDFGYARDSAADPAFLRHADVVQFDVTHKALDLWPYNTSAALVAYQHGEMGRNGDAPHDELELDASRGVTRVVSTLNLLPYVGGDADRWMPCVLDDCVLGMKARPRGDGVIRVVHSPSRRSNKQTEYIVAAVDLLRSLGEPIELDIIEGVTVEECVRRKAAGDICFDQLELCYGMSGVEAMYMGIPVVVGMSDETDAAVERVVGYRPYARAGRHDLALVLHRLIHDPNERRVLGDAGARYAREYHTPAAVAARRASFYESVASQERSTPVAAPRPGRERKVTLGVPVDFEGKRYPKKSKIPRSLAIRMRDAGVIAGRGL